MSKLSKKELPGISLEKTVTSIQKMMDPNSTVTHNEKLVDRVGNTRQYDVVIRGQFGGRPVLGIIECKDHSRREGPNTIEAFAKKTENLGANLRVIISRKGFTQQALKLAKHENIGCLSLLPENPEQVGFGIGDMLYGVIRMWANVRLTVHFESEESSIKKFDANTIKWKGKPVMNWFLKELFTTYAEEAKEGSHCLTVTFTKTRNIEIEGNEYRVVAITCNADREYRKKKKWVYWSGDALFDWNGNKLTIPPKGRVTSSVIDTDISMWDDFDGELPNFEDSSSLNGFITGIMVSQQKWDDSRDGDIPDMTEL